MNLNNIKNLINNASKPEMTITTTESKIYFSINTVNILEDSIEIMYIQPENPGVMGIHVIESGGKAYLGEDEVLSVDIVEDDFVASVINGELFGYGFSEDIEEESIVADPPEEES